ncbi:radical SAM protein [Shewanella sp. 5_MG-2023]|uniref:radical SAM protein n=1 Tax=Shewanella sp. 5_MG-2023 TaxID=3062656 RepID=UPI0026E4561A|nr:radical SAM protein [Shewanella sp. 5_MG-2023]MDO6640853.1 radical SAM protein [Shewanella sp. 5_MG-2023]
MLKFTSRSNTKYIYNQVDNNIFPIYDNSSWKTITSEFKKAYPSTNISFIGPDNKLFNEVKSEVLIINLTDSCNLRCTYCAYSEHYPFERNHNKAQISFNTAKIAIEEYLSRSNHLIRRRINLYGGEPTMASSLVYKIINFINSKAGNVDFSINTNAYSFTNEWIDFVIKITFNYK